MRALSRLTSLIRTHPVDTAVVGVSMLLGFWLRKGGLAPGSLWLDDAWVVTGIRADTFSELAATFATTPGFKKS